LSFTFEKRRRGGKGKSRTTEKRQEKKGKPGNGKEGKGKNWKRGEPPPLSALSDPLAGI